jgi:hypothetical protein
MMIKRFLVLIALCLGWVGHAAGQGTFPVGNIGSLENTYAFIYGWHAGDPGAFADVFSFQVSRAGATAGLIIPLPDANIPPADLAGIDALALLDSNYQFLAVSTDPLTNFFVQAWMPGAGTYELAVFGTGSPGNGFYFGAVATQLVPVPEPATGLLLLAGLVGIAAGSRGVSRR